MSAPVTFYKKVAASDTKLAATWSGVRESNPPVRLGKPTHYRCTNPAGEYLIIIPAGPQIVKSFFHPGGPLHRGGKDNILKKTVKGG